MFAETDRLDPGWRLEDIEANRLPFPAPDMNGFDQIVRIGNASLPRGWPEWPFTQLDDDRSYVTKVRAAMELSLEGDRMTPALLNAEQERVLRAELGQVAEAVAMARRMSEYPYGRFPIKWAKDIVTTNFNHHGLVGWVPHLMTYDAKLQSHQGHMDLALQDVKACVHASRALNDEPTMHSQILRIVCDTRAVRILEGSLANGQGSETGLLDLQKELEGEAATPFYLTGVRGERACFDSVLERMQRGEFSSQELERLIGGGVSFLVMGRHSSPGPSVLQNVMNFLAIGQMRARVLLLMNEAVEIGKLPEAERTQVVRSKENVWNREHPHLTDMIVSIPRFAMADLRAKAILRSAYCALAVERFRLAKGDWPKSLEELVPRFLPAVPADPFDGTPLHLERKDSAIIVHAVSSEWGSQIGAPGSSDWPTRGMDGRFILHDPSRRRQPGKPFVLPESAELKSP